MAFIYAVVIIFSLKSVFQNIINKPYLKSFNVYFNVSFIIVWVFSGLIMYFQASVSAGISNIAVSVHSWFTFLFLPWVLFHSFGHLIGKKIPWPNWWRGKTPVPEAITENHLEKRDFVKFTTLGILFIFIGAGIKWLLPILDTEDTSAKRRGYFRIYNVTSDYPRYKESDWSFTIDGLVENSITLTMNDMIRLPSLTIVDDFHCVTGWSVRNVEMKGILIKDIIEAHLITPLGPYATAFSGDQVYYDSFRLSQIVDEGMMLVFEFDGLQLVIPQGYPCRLYHPGMYGYKSVKWIERLEFTEERAEGYWQVMGGYDLDGYL
ncbi:molybdopterin-dependent oxidoreductase [Bacillaceae bacterium IKA-2]|nr:molybdopterin-dependent oxidoreductase [Bacillaceae bacterium IKA-2]